LAEECEKRGIDPAALAVRYAILGAEPWTEAIRQQVEKGLQLEATNIYGLSEIIGPGVSQEEVEEKGTGSYIWEDHFFPEVVDRDTGEPLPMGKEGVLVFTTITKQAMPLIRYWTNDICSIYYDSDAKRTHIKMSSIKGRSDDMLIIRGVNLFPTQIEAVFPQFDKLSPNYQLIVSRNGNLDEVRLRIEMEKGYAHSLREGAATNYEEQKVLLEKELVTKILNTIGLRIGVTIEPDGAIPRSAGGKLSRLVDERK
jgi:phenylacetate-CoA ligase